MVLESNDNGARVSGAQEELGDLEIKEVRTLDSKSAAGREDKRVRR
jgi:hypothetical protein